MDFEAGKMVFKLITDEAEKSLFVNAWEAAFVRKFDPQVSPWIFNDKNSMYAIFEEDKIIAGYCLLNNKAVYNGQIVEGALCNNVFVRPEYRGLNLFVKLSHYALAQAAEQGIKIVMGIPNENAVPGHKRVGWTSLDPIHFLEKNIIPVSKGQSDDHIKRIGKANYSVYQDDLERFSVNIARRRSFSILKDNSYFKWRYIDRPSVDYRIFIFMENDEILGYIVYKLYDALNRLHIVDVEAADEKAFNALIGLADYFEEPLGLVNVWDSSIYNAYFLNVGYRQSTESNHLIAIRPAVNETVQLGDKVNIVLGDNEVF